MTSLKLMRAAYAALDFLKLNKLCYIMEDKEFYYFTGCRDNGEQIYDAACCSVNKKTYETQNRYLDDKKLQGATPLPLPDADIFIKEQDAYER